MPLDLIWGWAKVEAPTIEEHDRDVNAVVPRSAYVVAQPVEVGLIEQVEVELRPGIRCRAGSSPPPRLRGHAQVETASGGLGLELFPTPEPYEVVTMRCE